MPSNRRGSLEIAEDFPFQRRSWLVQRVAWGFMALAILAALSGLFGSGPLSNAQSATPDGLLRIEYERFGRHNAPLTLRLHFARKVARDGEVRLWIDRAYLEDMKPERILPEPKNVEVGGERLLYVFPLGSAEGPGAITFDLKPGSAGVIHGRAGVDGGGELRFRQIIYP